jgi:undecaprenyl diphosphate synthase
MERKLIPQHIAIIMDGNGRWARERGLPRTAGHQQGIKRVREILRAAAEEKVGVITLFAFSAENWVRPRREIEMLMRSLHSFLTRQINELAKNNIRFKWIGREHPVPRYLLEKLQEAQERTKHNTGLLVVLAFNYSARQELVDAAGKFFEAVQRGEEKIEAWDGGRLSDYLYTAGIPDPDLLIRTSGEMRLSNFLLWQLSYAELYFPKKYWPDFTASDLKKAIAVYQKRERRFGAVHVGEKNI